MGCSEGGVAGATSGAEEGARMGLVEDDVEAAEDSQTGRSLRVSGCLAFPGAPWNISSNWRICSSRPFILRSRLAFSVVRARIFAWRSSITLFALATVGTPVAKDDNAGTVSREGM